MCWFGLSACVLQRWRHKKGVLKCTCALSVVRYVGLSDFGTMREQKLLQLVLL